MLRNGDASTEQVMPAEDKVEKPEEETKEVADAEMDVTLDVLIQHCGEEVLLNNWLKKAGMIRKNSPKCDGCGSMNLQYKTDQTGSCHWRCSGRAGTKCSTKVSALKGSYFQDHHFFTNQLKLIPTDKIGVSLSNGGWFST